MGALLWTLSVAFARSSAGIGLVGVGVDHGVSVYNPRMMSPMLAAVVFPLQLGEKGKGGRGNATHDNNLSTHSEYTSCQHTQITNHQTTYLHPLKYPTTSPPTTTSSNTSFNIHAAHQPLLCLFVCLSVCVSVCLCVCVSVLTNN